MRQNLVIILLFITHLNFGQNTTDYKAYDLQAPLDIPLLLSGNFAELRAHHFHAGIDFKTQGKTGLPVYAAADGYVSRINISTVGYGKALYIDHPELGLTTVYAHLSQYAPAIDSLAKAKHYELEAYNINFFPQERIYVKKGEIIAYSGNTGSSAGPHLHFEIRDRQTQDPINPLLFGFKIKDTTPPSINGLRLYPIAGEGALNKSNSASQYFPLVYYGGQYHLKGTPKIEAWGKIGFGINTLDYLDGSWNKCGIYSIQLYADSQLIFNQEMDRISYAEMRYIDAHVDQEVRSQHHVDYQYSFKAKPNNPLSIYKTIQNDGTLLINDSAVHHMAYHITDSYGNSSILEFKIQGKKMVIPADSSAKKLKWDQAHQFSTSRLQLRIPAGAFYEDQELNYVAMEDPRFLSPIFKIQNGNKPLNKKASVSIRPDKDSPVPLSKMLICKLDEKGKLSYQPTTVKEGVLSTEVYSFSQFVVSCDTIAPSLKALNIFDGKHFKQAETFGFKVKDDFSAVWDYRGTIDGQWALFYYEKKQDYIYYTLDPQRIEKGKKHHLEFEAWDATGNTVKYRANFYY